MSKLLHIVGSPRGSRSKSQAVGQAVVDAFLAQGDHTADELNVWTNDLPPFDGDVLNAKYAVMSGENFTPEQQAAWDRVAVMTDKLKSYDVVVVSTPMWNFGIPYALKHYIDVVSQPGLTFAFDPATGYSGLIENTKGVAVVARSSKYEGDAAAYDFQRPYVESWMQFVGIEHAATIDVAPTVGDPDAVAQAVEDAHAQAASIAASL